MPDRYWVGGTANWDGTAGTKWSATSGGLGGASVPTTADAVFFTNLSTGTCTIATGNTGAASINCTGFTGTITGTANITVAGSVTLVAAMTYTHTGTMTFTGTGTLTTASKSFSAVTVSGSGITLTLGDALNIGARRITVTQGTLTTSGFTVTAADLVSSNSNTRTINLGASTLNLSLSGSAINFSLSTNLTFNAGTSQINLSGLFANLDGGGQTFNNVSFTSSTATANIKNISGVNTFANLTFTAPSGNGIIRYAIVNNQTITGSLTCAGATAIRRIFVFSNNIGDTRTITAASISAADCDFRDITLAGAAAGAAPTRAGDCGGNSGITFPAAKTVYRVGTNTTWAGSSSWALTSGSTGSDANFPLAQDTAVVNDDTALTGTLTVSLFNISALDCSTRTFGLTLSHPSIVTRYGSFLLSGLETITGLSEQTFSGRGVMDISTAGVNLTFNMALSAPGGTFRLQDAVQTTGNAGFSHLFGTLNLNSFTLSVGVYTTTLPNARDITFNGGTLICRGSGAVVFRNQNSTGFTTTAGTGTGTISMTSASAKTFEGAGSTYNCTLNNGGAGALTITGSNTFTTLENSVQPTSFLFTAGTTQTLTNWNISGTAGNLVTIGSPTAASHTLSKASGTVNADYLSISFSTATGGATWNAGANSVNGGNNSGWIFAGSPTNQSNFFLLF